MKTTAHKPYAKFEDGEIVPILGYKDATAGKEPLVPSNESGKLIPASVYHDMGTEFDVIVHPENKKQLLHG